MMRVPFNRMVPVGHEMAYVAEAIAQSRIGAGGPFARGCEEILSSRVGGGAVLLTKSCTAALEISVRLLGLGPGDEVIMPSFTFVSAANAVCLAGATPKFVDIDADTQNMSADRAEEAVGPNTRALMLMHYAGRIASPDRLRSIAERHGLAIIEDAAHALGSLDDLERPAGSFGDLATLSFHETKNVGCGEGGALIVNEEAYLGRAHQIRDKGTNRRDFEEGKVDKYTWVEIGTSASLSEMHAAFLLGQLEELDTVTDKRRRLHSRYRQAFHDFAESGLVGLPQAVAGSNAHIFSLILPDLDSRERFIGGMAKRGVQSVFHYIPLHQSPMARSLGLGYSALDITEAMARRIVRLPLYASLSETEQDHVIRSATDVLETLSR